MSTVKIKKVFIDISIQIDMMLTMNERIAKWFRKVDIFPYMVNQMGLDHDGVPYAKRMWKTAYRDARERAQIMHHECLDLVEFRGFGVLKKIWAKSGNCIGRVRINDLRDMDNNTIAKCLGFQDYNPARRFEITLR